MQKSVARIRLRVVFSLLTYDMAEDDGSTVSSDEMLQLG
jgi:hypothetical protein